MSEAKTYIKSSKKIDRNELKKIKEPEKSSIIKKGWRNGIVKRMGEKQ